MKTHATLPDLPSGYPLSPCRGAWSIVVPAAATNLITNPSVELSTTGYSAFGAGMSRSTLDQRRGAYGLRVAPMIDESIISYAVTLAPETTYTFTVDVKGAPGVQYSLLVHDATAVADLPWRTEFRGTGRWERHRLSFITSANSLFGLWVQQDGGDVTPVYYLDGWQLCELPYETSYCDGDQPGCSWSGVRHASISSRGAQSRRGGREMALDDYGFTVLSELGLGMAPHEDITTPTGLLGGALYQRSVARVRSFSLVGQFSATSYAQLQRLRAELHAALSPFAVAEQGPLVLRYVPREGDRVIGDELELLCHYTGGLEGATDNLYGERAAISFSMYQPLITSVGDSGASLAASESIPDADYIVERTGGGAWRALAGGLGGGSAIHVSATAYGPDGNLYVGGHFTTAYNASGTGSPVTVDNIARWDGSSWIALGSGFNEEVTALAFDAAGNLYAGGYFTDVDYPYLARWDGVDWAPVDSAADGTGPVFALTFDGSGRLYVGGAFANWAAIAGADNIAVWDGSTWDDVDGGADDPVYALVTVPNSADQIVIGGDFTNAGGGAIDRIAQYNRTSDTWTQLGVGFADEVLALAYDASGILYAGGDFSAEDFIARRLANWGTTFLWANVGGGVNDLVAVIARDLLTNRMIVGGRFTTAGGRALSDRAAQWTGTEWLPLDIDLPGTSGVTAVASHADGRLALGYQDAGTATSSTTDATITNAGSAPAAPIITARGPGRVESLVNWTSGQGLYLDLDLQDGETLTIDLTPGAVSVTSDFRGNLGGSVLSGSDLASWRLLPGANTVVAKADVPIVLRWRTAYTSLAGAVS